MRLFRVSTLCMAAAALLTMASAGLAQDDGILAKVPQGSTIIIVVKDATALDGKVGAFLSQFLPPEMGMPPQGPEIMRNMLEDLVEDMANLKPGSPLIFAMKLKENFTQEPNVCLLLDMPKFKELTAGLTPDADGLYSIDGKDACEYQGMIMFGPSKDGLKAMKALPAGMKLSAEQKEVWSAVDVFAMVDLAAVVKAATPQYEEAHGQMVQGVEELKKQEGAAEQVAELQEKVNLIQDLWAVGRQLNWVAGGLTVGKDGLDAQFSAAVVPGGSMAGYLVGHPALGAKLTPALPNADKTWAAFWYSVDSKKMAGAMGAALQTIKKGLKLAGGGGGMFFGPDPEMLTRLMDVMEKAVTSKLELFSDQGAGLALVGKGGSPICGLLIEKVGDRAAYVKKTESMVKAQKEMAEASMGLLLAMAGDAKIETETTFDRDVQKVEGMSVDRMVVKMKFPPKGEENFGPDLGAFFQKLMGGDAVTTWMTHSGEYLLAEIGPAPDNLAAAAKAIQAGGGLAEVPEIAELRKHTLKDSNMVAFVSLSTYINIIMTSMMQAMGAPVPEMPPLPPGAMMPRTAISSSMGKDRVAGRIYVSTAELKQLVMNIMMMQMMMSQPPAQPGGGADPALM